MNFSAGLDELRGVRDDIKALRLELEKLERDRDRRVQELDAYGKAKPTGWRWRRV